MLTTDNERATGAGPVNRPGAGIQESGTGADEAGAEPPRQVAGEDSEDSFTFGRRLRRARLARQWSQLQLAHRMRTVGAAHRGAATTESLLIMLSKWENDRKHPNQYNLHLLAASLEIPVSALGLPVDRDFVF